MPFFAVGPGIAPGSYSTVPIIGYDFLPTFMDLVEAQQSVPVEVEGGSFKPVLMNRGRGEVKRPWQLVLLYSGVARIAMAVRLAIRGHILFAVFALMRDAESIVAQIGIECRYAVLIPPGQMQTVIV